jgi:hypothetical protein
MSDGLYDGYAYNFNPRSGPKDVKLRYLMKAGVMKRANIPIGKFEEHKRYQTNCRNSYIAYHECL